VGGAWPSYWRVVAQRIGAGTIGGTTITERSRRFGHATTSIM
jgi:hypothetical protein